MGYNTSFEGVINIAPPLTANEVEELNMFFDARHDDRNTPSIWCDLVAYESLIKWNGSEKTYALDEWIRYVINHFIGKDHTCNGKMIAHGEDYGDIWQIVVIDNEVSTRKGKIIFE